MPPSHATPSTHRTPRTVLAAIVAGLMLAGGAWAQDDRPRPDDPSQEPAFREGGAIERLDPPTQRDREGVTPEPATRIEPARPDLPGVADVGLPGASARLMPEGSHIVQRRGRLGRARDTWWFVFDTDEHGVADRPIAMLPCVNLMEMQRLDEMRTEGATFLVSGEVFVYHGRNYLLPLVFSIVAAPQDAPEPDAEPAPTPVFDDDDPDAEALMEELRSAMRQRTPGERPSSRTTPATAPGSPGAPGAPGGDAQSAPRREGEFLTSRQGRLWREREGRWRFVFDSGAAQAPGVDPPMVVLPCTALMEMERLIERRGEATPFVVSGRIYVFEGRNYLLPTMYVLARGHAEHASSAH